MVVEENGGNYGDEGFIFQATADIPDFNGNHPVLGVWVY
ncbi:MAG: glutathionylspermidine synthase family protein [Limisphaerales bacterium]